ncbi:MAG: EamA family transporter RarD [Candidatus Nanopelagicales bacterium]
MSRTPQQEERFGVISGLISYLMWGLLPLFWPLLKPATAFEILGHRIIWSLIFVLLLMQITHSWPVVKATIRDSKKATLVLIASFFVVCNWGIYIWAVNANHVVETSLGYFINPLLSVLLGMLFFGERLRPLQKLAVAIAAIAVIVLSFDYGRLPWIALGLAATFGIYGGLKKSINLPAIPGLMMETALILPFTIAYLYWFYQSSPAVLLSSTGLFILAIISGPLTALPLLFFGNATTRVPLTWLGIMQYLAPTLQFIIGVWVFNEEIGTLRIIGFLIVWSALVIFSIDAWRNNRAKQSAQ